MIPSWTASDAGAADASPSSGRHLAQPTLADLPGRAVGQLRDELHCRRALEAGQRAGDVRDDLPVEGVDDEGNADLLAVPATDLQGVRAVSQ